MHQFEYYCNDLHSDFQELSPMLDASVYNIFGIMSLAFRQSELHLALLKKIQSTLEVTYI